MSVNVTADHLAAAEKFVSSVKGSDGLAKLDVDKFWEDDSKAKADPWAADCPQVPLGIGMSSECVWTELNEPEQWYELLHNNAFQIPLNKRYNDISERVVGKRLLGEGIGNPGHSWPAVKALHDIFEGENEWDGWSYWLKQAATNPDELSGLLDRVEARVENLRDFILPENWDEEKARLTALGKKPPRYRGQRGPVTFAMSIYGVENLIYLIFDAPDLAKRYSNLILRAMLERARILDEEGGFTPETAPHGWYWCDDNCAMLNAEMYDFFAAPIMEGIFSRYCPEPGDGRGQHSDSDMAQHLPTLGRLGLNSANFGPNLTVSEIREHLPEAIIRGQLAPFTFSRNEEVNIVAEFLRDREQAREKKGLVFTTAGSINNGSRLSGLRLIMAAIQHFGY